MSARREERPDAAIAVVSEFWRRMASNDFASVAAVLAPDFVLDWPQSRERIRGAERFVAMNAEYPAHGPWVFTVHRIVGGPSEAVSDVSVTDGVQRARAVSFFTVADGRIVRMTEFWPEPFEPAAQRAHLTERME
jgi:ketosteroid isomerase-like protein